MTPEKSELLPCPMCIGVAYLQPDRFGYFVACNNSECAIQTDIYAEPRDAIERWNRREWIPENPDEQWIRRFANILDISEQGARDLFDAVLDAARAAEV